MILRMITIKSNANKISIKLKNLGNIDLSKLMRSLAGDLQDITEDAFQDEADPVTKKPWTDLKKITKDIRRRSGKWPGKKLQVKGRLASSITTKSGRTTAAIGTNVTYAGVHQFGSRRTPRRRFIGVSKIHLLSIRNRAEKFVKGKFNK